MNTLQKKLALLPAEMQEIWSTGRHWEIEENEDFIPHIPYYNQLLDFIGSGYQVS